MLVDTSKPVILSGTSNLPLAKAVCERLGISLMSQVSRFANGEVKPKILTNVRKKEVFVIQPTNAPAEHWDELCFLIDAARRASAQEITAVIPYCGYSRQERKDEPRVPISLKVKLDQVVAAGAHRLVIVDLHAAASQGSVNVPFDNLSATVLLLEQFPEMLRDLENTCLVTDAGYAKVLAQYARALRLEIVIAHKVRPTDQQNILEDAVRLIGTVKKRALLLDDIGDTFRTARNIGIAVKKAGAEEIAAAVIHGEFSRHENPKKDAIHNIIDSPFDEIVATDSINIPQEKRDALFAAGKKLKIVSLADILTRAIAAIYTGDSVSDIFDDGIKRLKQLAHRD